MQKLFGFSVFLHVIPDVDALLLVRISFQVFFAEWMDFKRDNLTASVWPRISAYTTDILKELFTLARDPDRRFRVSVSPVCWRFYFTLKKRVH